MEEKVKFKSRKEWTPEALEWLKKWLNYEAV